MQKLLPETNVLFAYIGGLIAAVLLHYAGKFGYTVPPDVALGLPAGITAVIAHGIDVVFPDKPKV